MMYIASLLVFITLQNSTLFQVLIQASLLNCISYHICFFFFNIFW